jgi:hypothetical protein
MLRAGLESCSLAHRFDSAFRPQRDVKLKDHNCAPPGNPASSQRVAPEEGVKHQSLGPSLVIVTNPGSRMFDPHVLHTRANHGEPLRTVLRTTLLQAYIAQLKAATF